MRFLNEREELVLRTVIDEYIDTHEPVGSRNVSKVGPLKMSPATIRNIMSDLVDKGFIAQPHTSAGRVPTDEGYRYYIDKLVSTQVTSVDLIKSIQEQMTFDPINVMNLFRVFSKKLGDMTNAVGFIVSPKLNSMYMKHIEFVRLNKDTVLAVLVARSGIVRNILLEASDKDFSDEDLIRMGNYLNGNFHESSLAEIRNNLFNEMRQEHGEIRTLLDKTKKVGKALFDSPAFEEEFIFEGTGNIVDTPELKNSGKLKEVLSAFEEKRRICSILDNCMTNNSVQIFVGSEIGLKDMEELGLVIKPYQRGGHIIGTLGVIGPKRMKYPKVVSIVDYSSGIISRMLDEYYGGEDVR